MAISDYVFDRVVQVEAVDEKSRSHGSYSIKEQKNPEPVTRGGPRSLRPNGEDYSNITSNLTFQQVVYPRYFQKVSPKVSEKCLAPVLRENVIRFARG